MTPDLVVELTRRTVEAAVLLSLPIMAVALVLSVVISLVQVLTSMQDNTLSTVPRLLIVGASAYLLTPWMMHRLMYFTQTILSDLGRFAR